MDTPPPRSAVIYARVSSENDRQDTTRQITDLQGYAARENIIVKKVFTEHISGVKKIEERAILQECLDYCCTQGIQILLLSEISRLGRSTRDLLNIIDVLQKKGVTLVSSKENIDTNTPQGRFVLSIFAALSELEREQTLQRQREGIAIAKAQGKYKGREPLPIDWEKFGKFYEQWKAGNITAVWFQKEMGLRPNTFYRRLREYEEKYM